MTDNQVQAPGRPLAGVAESHLLNAFFILYKTARIIEEHNLAYQNQLDHFFDLFQNMSDELGSMSFKVISERFFLNEKMVRFDADGLSGAASVVSEWELLGIGGVHFNEGITREEISSFFQFLSSVKPNQDNIESLSKAIAEHGMEKIELLSRRNIDPDAPVVDEQIRRQFRAMARKTFFQAVSVVEEVVVNSEQDKEINTAKTKRVVHSLIDQISRDESSLIELTAIKNYDNYTYAHSTNVAIYALTMGIRLGLDRGRLSQLGFSALFHDIGKVKLPHDLISKPDAYDEDDWLQMQRHPHLGAKTILRNMKLDMHTARAARGAFEHHINSDFTGYPMLRYKKREPGLFSKILSIVDSFDALTSGRLYLKKGLAPDVVMKKLRFQMRIKFDPFLLKLFNDIIGIYPAGSLVLLTTDEIALVLTNNDTDKGRPFVKIVGNTEGLLSEPLWVDLSKDDQQERKIVRQIEPERYGLNVKDFIIDD